MKIRAGLVGCGRISKNHLEALQKLASDVEIVAVCDTNPENLAAAVKSTGAKGYSDLPSLLKDSNCDFVSLCTPSGLHPEQTILAAAAGKHVVSEKPMSVTWEAALRMVRACDEAKVKLFVVKQNRFNAPLQMLKRALDKGRFGKIYMAAVNVFWTRPQDYYDQAPWRGTWKLDGGAYMNQASHYVDLLRWLMGPVDEVHAFTATLARKIEAEDSGVVNVRFKSGALGSMNVTMLTYPKNLEGSITILGERGTVRIGGMAVNKIEQWDFADKDADDEQVAAVSYATSSVYGFGHETYYRNVVDTLRGKATASTDGREGLKSLELLIGIYESVRKKSTVKLPLDSQGLLT
ncbi:MAG: Gfo/Idh/MocA family oxidoreductase [Bdellovibrionales bacterium]|nr:Gfo/Idh/MocA family oxidoreductase [Bdellovibrionales bacterium]